MSRTPFPYVLLLAAALLLCAPLRAQEDEPVAPPPWLAANAEGVAHHEAGRHEEAVRAFERSLRLGEVAEVATLDSVRRNLVRAHLALVGGLVDRGEYEAALRRIRAARQVGGAEAEIDSWEGILWYRRGYLVAALDRFLDAARRDPEDAGPHEWMGLIHDRQEQLEQAIASWETAIRLDPERAEALKPRLDKARRELAAESGMRRERSTHFVCKYGDEQGRGIAVTVLDWLEDDWTRLGRLLDVYPEQTLTVILYADREFHAVTGAHSWVGGLFDGKVRIPVRNFERRKDELRRTLSHEYAHFLVRTLTRRAPAWIDEGFAQIAEGGDPRRRDAAVRSAIAAGRLIPEAELRKSFARSADPTWVSGAYSQALSLTAWLLRNFTVTDLRGFLDRLARDEPQDAAFRAAFGRTLEEAWKAWLDDLGAAERR